MEIVVTQSGVSGTSARSSSITSSILLTASSTYEEVTGSSAIVACTAGSPGGREFLKTARHQLSLEQVQRDARGTRLVQARHRFVRLDRVRREPKIERLCALSFTSPSSTSTALFIVTTLTKTMCDEKCAVISGALVRELRRRMTSEQAI